jgi:hypothetical protein
MNQDFFTRLIDRYSGAAQTVEPRIGSRYEEHRAGEQPQFELFSAHAGRDRSAAATDSQTRPVEPTVSSVSATGRKNATRATARRTDAESGRDETRNVRPAYARMETPQPDLAERSAVPARAEPQGEHVPGRRIESLLAHLGAPARSHGALQPRDNGSAPSASREPPPASGRETRANGRLGAMVAAQPQRAAGAPRAPEQAPLQPAERAADFAAPDWVAALRGRLSHRRSPSERAVEPVINVTIGRVEVTAVREPVQTSPPHRKAPAVMSLDDYLARRQRDERS